MNGGCRSCHGSAEGSAPPKAIDGSQATTAIGVGAHRAHVFGGTIGRGAGCTACHLEPKKTEDPGHTDTPLPAEIVFGDWSANDGATPVWSHDGATCSNTYCHGGTLGGGTNTAPIWTQVDGTFSACGSCHGLPPPDPHPQNDRCEQCHAPVAGPDKTIASPGLHVDGKVDARDLASCIACHGSKENAAPPRDTNGEGDVRLVTIGAHQTHLGGGASSRPLTCVECHVEPLSIDDPGHIDGDDIAELVFGAIAREGGATPSWNRAEETCATTYCHGNTEPPIWTRVDGTQAACGDCHGIPPAAPHPQNEACQLCHLPTAGPANTIADRTKHVDGVLQVSAEGCTGCHGTAENTAPPLDTMMRSANSEITVGAHRAHLDGGRFSNPIACTTCHVVPAAIADPGHIDASPAELVFGGLAIARNAAPVWSREAATCSNTYCHGATLSGGTIAAPLWTASGGDQAACGSCHGTPPPAPHVQNNECQLCHAPTAGPNKTIAEKRTHVDGRIQVSDGDCSSCHGSAASSAPPKDLMNNVDPTSRGVGAHRAHLEAQISRPIACAECHLVPIERDSPGHIDSDLPAELVFGTVSTASGASPLFDPASATCANTYCHGATLRDGQLTAPVWTIADGTQAACGTCHGTPPGAPHPSDERCELCHLPTAGPTQTIASPSTHIDGVLQVQTGCDSCHGENGASAPPRDLDGNTTTDRITVGAHRAHLNGGLASRPVECSECHVVPALLDSAGHIDTARPAELVFGAISSAEGHSPSWTAPSCGNTYCHGGSGAAVPAPRWTSVDGTQNRCDSCHGNPPPSAVHQGQTECAGCHLPTAGPGGTIAQRATHVDGVLQVTALDCNSCHGDMTSPAPPRDLSGAIDPNDPEVGAHRVHLTGGASSQPIACGSCHRVPARTEDPGHLDPILPAEIIFGGLSAAAQTTPQWIGAERRCAGSYCHGGASSAGDNPEPVWNAPGTADCGSCHGLPPAAPHPQVDRCEVCHAGVAGPGRTIVDRTRHVDGLVQLNGAVACERCHGSAQSPAPPQDLSGAGAGPRVGAHRVHLSGTPRSRAVECSECHVPVAANAQNAAGHYDSARPAELIFGVLARQGGANPSFNNGSCSNTYCHGASIPGAAAPTPSWTGAALACNACHGMPPPDAAHGNGTATQCQACHPDTAGPNQTIIGASRHVNGVIDTSATCDACHGNNGVPTPPRDLAGLNSSDRVGAHAAHRAPSLSAPVACETCHLVPQVYSSPGHADSAGPAEVGLTLRAALAGAAPNYTSTTKTCSNTYCHGATLAGGKTAVSWTDADGSEAQCGACHGMPPATPAHNGVGANSCNSCHQDDAGSNSTITTPALHADGILQVSGGGCDTCHGSPPAPGRESYAGSAGAHAAHAGRLGFECATCHGNNGSGAEHNQGNGTVNRSNVQIRFAANLSFPGGTTMRNGQANTIYDLGTRTCGVGCHNPIVGNPNETPALANRITWNAGAPSCTGCHDTIATASPRNHNVGPGNAGCTTCHDQAQHLSGNVGIRDPDPTDAFAYSALQPDGLCRTCHDGSGGTAFGRPAPNESAFWTTSSHGAEGYRCGECHAYHGSNNGPLLIDRANASCLASGCHDSLAAEFAQVPGGPISHHRIEGGPGIQLFCISCHNPHVSRAHPNAAIDPDNKAVIYSLPDSARTQRRSAGDYRGFCLRCHDATPPPGVSGAMNIAAALAGGNDPTHFKKNGGDSLHKEAHSGYNCQNCHDTHASNGTLGTNRGRLLFNYMTVNRFPYGEKNSCSTPRPIPGFGFGCH